MGLSDIMRLTRTKYYYATRSVKRNKDEIIRVRFAEALLSDNDRNFWSDSKKLRYNKSLSSNVVDDCYTDIADFVWYKNIQICIPVCIQC